MKKINVLLVVFFLLVAVHELRAQVSPGVDLYSSYIWRGAKFGTGPAIQPYVDCTTGGLSVGAWGSVCTSTDEALEMDLYAKYAFDFGVTVGVNDYYFGGKYFADNTHFVEPTLSFSKGGFSLMGAYMLGNETRDTYVEAGYGIKNVNLFVGVGNGQYTTDGDFTVCNIGIKATEEIKLTESFSLPINGSVILNPSTQAFFIVVGISL